MKKLIEIIIIGSFIIGILFLLYYTVSKAGAEKKLMDRALSDDVIGLFDEQVKAIQAAKLSLEQTRIQTEQMREAQMQAQIRNAGRWISEMFTVKLRVYQSFLYAMVFVPSFSLILLSYFYGFAYLRQKSVHQIVIGSSSWYIHHKALSSPEQIRFTQAAMLVEGVRAQNPEKAIELAGELIRSMGGRKGLSISPGVENLGEPVVNSISTPSIPSFSTLVSEGKIGRNHPLIFGFHEGIPMTGTWDDLYSCAIGGKSRSGKTSTLRSLICQSLLQGCEFWIIDPHSNHPDGLQFSLRPLLRSSQIHIDLPVNTLKQVNQTISARLSGIDTDRTPKILVVDEFLQSSKIPGMLDTVLRIGTESAKINVFGLFAGHTWLSSKTGNNSAVRDNLTSVFVHSMKKGQARPLLQEKELVDQVPALHKGQAIFAPVNDDPVFLDIPFCTKSDVEIIAGMLSNDAPGRGVEMAGVEKVSQQRTEGEIGIEKSRIISAEFLKEIILYRQKHCNDLGEPLSIGKLSHLAGVNKAQLSKILNRREVLTEGVEKKLKTLLTTC